MKPFRWDTLPKPLRYYWFWAKAKLFFLFIGVRDIPAAVGNLNTIYADALRSGREKGMGKTDADQWYLVDLMHVPLSEYGSDKPGNIQHRLMDVLARETVLEVEKKLTQDQLDLCIAQNSRLALLVDDLSTSLGLSYRALLKLKPDCSETRWAKESLDNLSSSMAGMPSAAQFIKQGDHRD